jgi:hypothetical protein
MAKINLGNIEVEVVQKEIKNIHLSVYPPNGRVKISAPKKFKIDTIRLFAISKLPWIKQQQQKINSQKREAPREYLNKESHYFLGKRYQLKVIEIDSVPRANLTHKTIELYVRPDSDINKRKEILENWYRENLRKLAGELVAKYEKKIGVKANEIGIKKMKTKWGTCNAEQKRIWLNLELSKKPRECIEYIVVHELVHFKERTHNDRFISFMGTYLPNWKDLRKELNRLPVSHVDWGY